MLSNWQWLLSRLRRTLWIRVSLVGLLGVLAALLALPVQTLVQQPLPFTIGSSAVDGILQILATSMLTVTIFSLSVMVSAYSAASSDVTPRATRLIKQDPITQNTLATFLGSFLFSLVGIIALSTDLYNEVGRFVLFLATLSVLVSIVLTLVRWIDHLSGLGQVSRTTSQVESKVRAVLDERTRYPNLGGVPMLDADAIPADAIPVYIEPVGFVQHVDMTALAECAEVHDVRIGILAIPGKLTHPCKIAAWYLAGKQNPDVEECIRKALAIDIERSFDQDPRFGFSVLSEIASRALSPSTNDPGTAIDVINRLLRLLLRFGRELPQVPENNVLYPRLSIAPLLVADLFEDAFMPIARDGAGLFEVQLRLQKVLLALRENNPRLFAEEAAWMSGLAMQFAERAALLDSEKARLRELAQVFHTESRA